MSIQNHEVSFKVFFHYLNKLHSGMVFEE